MEDMTKQEKIKKLIAMQKKFIDKEHKGGVSMSEYFLPSEDSELYSYREDYIQLAMNVVDDAHSEVGSKG